MEIEEVEKTVIEMLEKQHPEAPIWMYYPAEGVHRFVPSNRTAQSIWETAKAAFLAAEKKNGKLLWWQIPGGFVEAGYQDNSYMVWDIAPDRAVGYLSHMVEKGGVMYFV